MILARRAGEYASSLVAPQLGRVPSCQRQCPIHKAEHESTRSSTCTFRATERPSQPGAATLKILQPCVVHLVSGRDPLAWLRTYGCMLRWRKARSASEPEVNPTAQRPGTLERTMLQPLPLWTVSGQRPKSHPAGLQVQRQGDREAHRPCMVERDCEGRPPR